MAAISLAAVAALVALYSTALLALIAAGRRGDAVAVARFVPDCLVLLRGLARDARIRRGVKIAVVAVIAYLASPIDLVPDVLPIVGLLDDAILVAIVVRAVVRAAGRGVLAEHWRGPERSLLVLLRLCAVEA